MTEIASDKAVQVTKHALERQLKIPHNGGKTVDDLMGILIRQDLVFEPIRRLHKTDEYVQMYDIEVEKAGHFVANGAIVHNCSHVYKLLVTPSTLATLRRLDEQRDQ